MDSIEEKIKRVQAGEVYLFSDIIRLYQQRIYLYCFRLLNNKEEAEDAVQDIFIKAYQNISQFEAKCGGGQWKCVSFKYSQIKNECPIVPIFTIFDIK